MLHVEVPYEKQEDAWMCGAASLCMVYRSLEVPCVQADVWERVVYHDEWGRPGARTRDLAHDALRRGLNVLVLQARHAWELLERCLSQSLRVILNHRLAYGLSHWHFSVLQSIDDGHAVLQDPYTGPGRRKSRDEFIELWQPEDEYAAGTAHVLVALARPVLARQPGRCDACDTPVPETKVCPECRKAIVLQPAGALGCIRDGCPERHWLRIFCPHCDAGLTDLAQSDRLPNEEDQDMPTPGDLAKFSKAFEEYQRSLSEAVKNGAGVPPEAQEMIGKLQQLYGDFMTQAEKHNQATDARMKDTLEQLKAEKGKAQEAAAARKETLAKVAAKKKAKAEPKSPPPIDPLLSEKLRSQLLEEFGNRPHTAPVTVDEREIWEDWDETP